VVQGRIVALQGAGDDGQAIGGVHGGKDAMSEHESLENLAAKIDGLVHEYSARAHADHGPARLGFQAFEPGKTPVPYAGRVFAGDEVAAAVRATLDFWLTLGPQGDAFESELAAALGVARSILTNSGSSANLLAVSALTSAKLPPEKRLRPGDEVITCAAGFPTTVAPIVQAGAVPVFIDSNPRTGNADCTQLENAFAPGRTKAVMLAHALGNPFDVAAVAAFCRAHDLWLIEDNCDALGSLYTLPGNAARPTGTFGDLSTQSFYPPHHITMGEGGAVNIARDMRFKVIIESFRDWGRDCWCESGMENTCGKRFGWQLGELPKGYDHKYTYSHLGYNLKPLDVQAAIGREQLKRLPDFVGARRRNWQRLRDALSPLSEFLDFMQATPGSEPSWFGFMMLVRDGAPFTAVDLSRHLDERKVGNRRLFGGNLVRQPAFVQLRKDNPAAFRVAGELKGADRLMQSALFVGVYPGLTDAMLDYVIEVIGAYCRKNT
jgi:CDP-4-dehydro-6-deoxyglucose reductase, E1